MPGQVGSSPILTGYSGYSGNTGTSGASGTSGMSGFSGISGISGFAASAKAAYGFVYNFATLGGAQGTIPLTALTTAIPNNFVIQNAFLDVITPLGSGGAATAAVTTGQSAGDLVAATVVIGAPFSVTGPKVMIPLFGTIATWIKTTSTRTPAIVIALADLNAGKFNVFVEGYVSA